MKNLLPLTALAFSAALSACSDSNPPAPPAPEPVTSIRGHVTAGAGTGTVTLRGAAGQTLSSATVESGGNFTLNLPTGTPLKAELVTADQALAKVGCDGTLNSSATGAKGFGVAALTLSRNSAPVDLLPIRVTVNRVPIVNVPIGGSFDGRVWLYTDQPTRLTGTLNCTKIVNAGIPITIAVDVTTVNGWNLLQLSGAASLSGSSVAVNGTLKETSAPWTEWKTLPELQAALKL